MYIDRAFTSIKIAQNRWFEKISKQYHKKARQARIGHHGRSERSERFPRHRGYMSAAAHSLEAESNYLMYKKRVGECHSPTLFFLEAGSRFPEQKKARNKMFRAVLVILRLHTYGSVTAAGEVTPAGKIYAEVTP
ncbi:MAG: hypothetical protein FWF77_06105 [Defluviitaleaceae bacterium]|nr:hypothetical protein [Defluviitaleaceae bacterium]